MRRASFKRKWRKENDLAYAAKHREYQREYWLKNKDRLREKQNAWVEANRAHVNAYRRRRYLLNPAAREYQREYYKAARMGKGGTLAGCSND